jgi:1,4-alpha-glucan branching enzyme
MSHLARSNMDPDPLTLRALNQAARELLLAQSSDWAFIMKIGAVASYAQKRINIHLLRFTRLFEEITAADIGENNLSHIESLDNIFPDIDYTVFS